MKPYDRYKQKLQQMPNEQLQKEFDRHTDELLRTLISIEAVRRHMRLKKG
jgi:hypothetical protein